MKKYALALMAVALILGAGAGISLAYLTDADQTVNRFSAVDTKIQMEEEFDPPGEITPGTIITKKPMVTNTSGAACYVRANIWFTSSDAQNLCEPLAISSGWEKRQDGWYYWKMALSPNTSTAPLFEQIRIRSDAKEECPAFDVLIYAEAVGCAGQEAEDAWNNMDQQV